MSPFKKLGERRYTLLDNTPIIYLRPCIYVYLFHLPCYYIIYRCGHCKNLAPHWASAATELKGKVKLGALDATVHTVMASRYGIQGFPTIKYFPAGRKDWDSAQDYDGGRTGSDIVQWATNKWSENLPPPEVYQVLALELYK